MNYELALKLKNAGFPQKYRAGNLVRVTHTEGDVYIPTLEELIEVCGDKFHKLELNSSAEGETKWSAYEFRMSDEWKDGEYHYVFGSTPGIAVANLWLKLNSK